MSDLQAQGLFTELAALREEILERSLTNIQKNALRRAEADSPEALAVAKDLIRLVNQAEKSQHRADANASTINRLETELSRLKQNPPAAAASSGTIWAKVYTDDGYQISLTLPAATVADALKHMAEIRAAGLLPAPTEPPSMEETETITTVVRREHFDKATNTIVPVIDCFPDWRGRYGQFRFTSIYLDTPADVAQFEAHAGVKLDSLPLYESQSALVRNTARPHRCEVKCKAFVVCKKYSGDNEVDGKVQRVFRFSHFVSADGYAAVGARRDAPAAANPEVQPVVPASMISPDVQTALPAKPTAPAVGTPHGASAKPVTPPAGGNPFEIPATQNAIIHAIRANGFTASNFAFLFSNIIPGKTLTAVRDAHPHITPDEFLKRLPGVAALYQARLDHETHVDDDGYQPDPDDDPAPTTGARGQSSKPAAPARSTGKPAAADPSTDDVRNVLGSRPGSSTRQPHPLHGEMVEIDRIEGCRDRRGFAWEQNKWIAHGTSVTPSGLVAAFSLTIWPEDARKLTDAGHAIEWPSGANEYAPFILHPSPVVIAEFRGSSGLCIRTVEPVSAPARKRA